MVKRFLLGIIVVLFASCDSGHQYKTLSPNANVVVLGDSLTYGTGAADGEDYVSLLSADTGWKITNAGVPGNTSADG
ncbi:MAG TPA: arylesterase, partial [Methylotenera mobilis]|nr:arylesterase [Methylotenera mobilis]